jgi:hypothetical protein
MNSPSQAANGWAASIGTSCARAGAIQTIRNRQIRSRLTCRNLDKDKTLSTGAPTAHAYAVGWKHYPAMPATSVVLGMAGQQRAAQSGSLDVSSGQSRNK